MRAVVRAFYHWPTVKNGPNWSSLVLIHPHPGPPGTLKISRIPRFHLAQLTILNTVCHLQTQWWFRRNSLRASGEAAAPPMSWTTLSRRLSVTISPPFELGEELASKNSCILARYDHVFHPRFPRVSDTPAMLKCRDKKTSVECKKTDCDGSPSACRICGEVNRNQENQSLRRSACFIVTKVNCE